MHVPRHLTRRSFLAGAVAALAVVPAIQACGAPAASPTAAPATAAPTTATAATTAAKPAAQAAPAEIVLWPRSTSDESVFNDMKPLVAQQAPGLTVKLETPPDNIYEKLQVALAGNVGPDTTVINMPWGVPMITKGMWRNLRDYLKSDAETQRILNEEFAKPAIQSYTFKGDLYAVPVTSESIVLWYNEDKIKQAGLTPPAEIEDDPAKWNWDTLLEYGRKLTKGTGRDRESYGIHVYGTPGDYGLQSGWGNLVYSNGGRIVSEDGEKWVLNSPEGRAALQYAMDTFMKHDVAPAADTNSNASANTARTLFQGGKLGLMFDGEFFRRNLFGPRAPQAGIPFKWNLAQLPFAPKTNKRGMVYHTLALPISKDSKNPDAVWRFFSVFATKAAQQLITDKWGSRAANTKTYDPWLKANAGGGPVANWAAITKADGYGIPFPVSPYLESKALLETHSRVLYDVVFQGKQSLDEGLAEIEKETNARLAKAIQELKR
jgi:multiple sugar transport system substrate-binding protein